MDNAHCDSAPWWMIPESAFVAILSYLSPREILNCGCTCRRWYQMSGDNLTWKHKFHHYFKTDPSISLRPGAETWKQEYIRLCSNIPLVMTEKLEGHTHQVLHVSFSHNGKMFATCSKDGNVIVWNVGHPCSEKFYHNMKLFSWKYTQYSQFNQSDTLLLVSGIHFGLSDITSGEIAVFTINNDSESTLRCRVVNRPYDTFGTWFCDQYLISGDLHWLAYLVSTSVLWLNKASQEVSSEHLPVMNQLYKFYNRNASSVRVLIIAKCPWLEASNDPLNNENETEDSTLANTQSDNTSSISRISLSHNEDEGISKERNTESESVQCINQPDATIHYLDDFHKDFEDPGKDRNKENEPITSPDSSEEDVTDNNEDTDDEMESSIPKYLIFLTGSLTYTPHQVGIKRIRNVTFPKRLDPGPTLRERIAAKKSAKEEQMNQPRPESDWWNYEAVADRFDKVDKIIDLHGHIIGMALSPDHRYLYVNTRPWPVGYVISNALDPPPIAQEIDIHVIDLMTLKRVGNMLKAHKAYTPGTECFFIFLDVSDHYVASGAEDKHAYIWDRYYGISLAKYKHDDVVNSVAFNPQDSEMLVTTSDDYSIKVWRSIDKAKQLGLDLDKCCRATKLCPK